jgi:hypothetical protein
MGEIHLELFFSLAKVAHYHLEMMLSWGILSLGSDDAGGGMMGMGMHGIQELRARMSRIVGLHIDGYVR